MSPAKEPSANKDHINRIIGAFDGLLTAKGAFLMGSV